MLVINRWLLCIGLIIALIQQVVAADYYKILGVPRSASERDIKKAYRKLSKEFHPDKNPGNEEAAQKFVEIAGAYEVLSDKEQRAKYDQFGEEGLKAGHPGANPMKNAFDIFSNFFGSGSFGTHGEQRVQRGPDAQTFTECSLMDAYRGGVLELTINMQGICEECDGTGSADGLEHTCMSCSGHGVKIIRHQLAPGMFQQIQTPCEVCGGSGKQISTPCSVCHGSKVVREDRKYSVAIDRGAPKSFDHRIRGEADQSPDWEAGDLIIRIKESRDNNLGYRRKGLNLYRKEALSAKQAIKGGWSRSISFLDDESHINISRKDGQQVVNGEIETIKGKGMPVLGKQGEYGDLFIEYVVILPGKSPRGGIHEDL